MKTAKMASPCSTLRPLGLVFALIKEKTTHNVSIIHKYLYCIILTSRSSEPGMAAS